MIHPSLHRHLVVGTLAFAMVACVDTPTPQQPQMELYFAPLDSSCQQTVNGSNSVPSEISRLVAIITRPDGQQSTFRVDRSKVQATGTWLIKGIDEGDSLSLEVFGCDASGAVKYAGQSENISVVSQQKASIRAFLAPVGTLACTGDASLGNGVDGKSKGLPEPNSMASPTALANGDVLLTGGLGSWIAGEQRGTATRMTAIYDHQVGHFRAGPNLSAPRVWHHTIALTSTRALVVGGVSKLNAIGDNSLPAPVMMPSDLKQAWVTPAAEVLDLETDAAGLAKPPLASKADVGAGANLSSSSVRMGDAVWFVGGLDKDGTASAVATQLTDLNAVAQGEAGKRTDITLKFARMRPGLLPMSDGSLLVWGGNVNAQTDQTGEWIASAGDSSKVVAVDGDEEVLKDPLLVTADPAVAMLKEDAKSAVFLVVGGMPFASPLSSATAPSYVVSFDKGAGKATLKSLAVAGKALYGGLGTTALRMSDGDVLVAGGLVSLSASEPCGADKPECLLSDVFVLPGDADFSAAALNLTPRHTASFSTGQTGVAMAALPKGALLAGGQSAVVNGADSEPLTATARVVVKVPVDAATICGP